MPEQLMTIAEAARYCSVTPSAIRRAFRESGGPLHEMASPMQYGARIVQGVSKADVDRLRAAGFLCSRPGRRRGGITRRKVFNAAS